MTEYTPKKVKHRKAFKGRVRGNTTRGASISFGDFGLKAMECGRIEPKHLKAARIAITRYLGRSGVKIWMRAIPNVPFTQKAAGVRMGSGKGAPEGFFFRAQRGRIILEVGGGIAIRSQKAKVIEALNRAAAKFPIAMKPIYKIELDFLEHEEVLANAVVGDLAAA